MENNVKNQYIKKAAEMNRSIAIVNKIEKEVMDFSPEGFLSLLALITDMYMAGNEDYYDMSALKKVVDISESLHNC